MKIKYVKSDNRLNLGLGMGFNSSWFGINTVRHKQPCDIWVSSGEHIETDGTYDIPGLLTDWDETRCYLPKGYLDEN